MTNPLILGEASTSTTTDASGVPIIPTIRDIAVSKDAGLVYVTTYNSIQVYDIKNQGKPKFLNEITALPDPSGALNPDGSPRMIPIGETPAIVEKGGWVYLANATKGFRALDLDPVVLALDQPVSIKIDTPMKGKAINNEVYFVYTLTPQTKEGFNPATSTLTVLEEETNRTIFEQSNIPHTPGKHVIQFKAKDIGWEFDVKKRYIVKIFFEDHPKPLKESARIPLEWQAIATDYDRNGSIDDLDIKHASEGNIDRTANSIGVFPEATNRHYFWINDNADVNDIEGTSIPGSGKDYEKTSISGTRDLVDYFPVLLKVGNLVNQLTSDRYSYVLKQGQEAANYLDTVMNSSNSRKYLTDVDFANNLVSTATKVKITKDGIPLDADTIENLRIDGVEEVVLIDGRMRSRKPLILEVKDKIKKDVAFRTELPLSIDDVENMFRHKNLIREMAKIEANPSLGASIGVTPITGHVMPDLNKRGKADRLAAADFKDSQDHFEGFTAGKSGDFVHVHGYNVNNEDSRGEQTEVFKRLYWSGSNTRFWGITWYGWDSQDYILTFGTKSPNYHINIRHAFNAGKLLKHFVTNSSPSPSNATYSAHSLGNMVVSTAIQSGMPYANYLMVNAAVAEEAYLERTNYEGAGWDTSTRPLMYNVDWQYPKDENNRYEPFLWQSEWYKLFTDPADVRKTLTWRDNFSSARNDNVYTFFAPTDEAFRPFKVTLDDLNVTPLPSVTDTGAGKAYDGEKTKKSIMVTMLGNWVRGWFDSERIGTYGFVYNELLKGINAAAMPDSKYGGWGFNVDSSDGYKNGYCVGEGADRVCSYIKPEQANMLIIDSNILKTKPLFDKSNPENSVLFTTNPVGSSVLKTAMRERMLANEIPALTFAVGHRGVNGFKNNTDIRAKYLIENNAPWPRGDDDYEWRHSDFVNVAYPYLYQLYDDFKQISK